MAIPVSIQLYSMREAVTKNFFGTLAKVAKMGYVGVETAGLLGKKPEEVRKVIDDLGLVVSGMHVRLAAADSVQEQADAAHALGCKNIICPGYGGDWTTRKGVEETAMHFRMTAELLKRRKLTLGFHNHTREMVKVGGQTAYELLLKLVPELWGQLDIYWASNYGKVDVLKLIRKNVNRLASLHVKDGPLVEGKPHTAVGAGKMDIAACIKAVDPAVTKWLVVELDECATDMITAVRESFNYLVGKGLARGRK